MILQPGVVPGRLSQAPRRDAVRPLQEGVDIALEFLPRADAQVRATERAFAIDEERDRQPPHRAVRCPGSPRARARPTSDS